MCMLCYLSDFFRSIGFPLVMGFVAIFVPGTKYITCDELAEYVEESKTLYDENNSNHSLNNEEARHMLQMQKRKFLLLDARRKDEFCVSHIYNATNVHSTFTHGKDAIKELNDRLEQVCDEDTLLVMYCAVGLRSAWLAKHLTSQGYTNCKVLYHGFYEWTNEGRPIYGQNCVSVRPVSPKTPKTPKTRKQTKDPPIHDVDLIKPSSSSSSSSCSSFSSSSCSCSSSSSSASSSTSLSSPLPTDKSHNSHMSPPQVTHPTTLSSSVSSRSQQSPNSLVESSITNVCLCQLQPEVVHMCNNLAHGCAQTNRVAPQHFIASLALKQTLSTKYKFPYWLSSHRTIASLPGPFDAAQIGSPKM